MYWFQSIILNHRDSLISEDNTSWSPTLDALWDFCGLFWCYNPFQVPNHRVTLISEYDTNCPLTLNVLRNFCGLYWSYDPFQIPNHRIISIGEDGTRFPLVLYKILVLLEILRGSYEISIWLETLYGSYDFWFVRVAVWAIPLDFIQDILTDLIQEP